MNKVSVLIVIVNYRVADLVVECLQSLAPEVASLENAKVVIVDNNSGDESVERITQAIDNHQWSSWASCVRSEQNKGYAYGNNLAIRTALQQTKPPDYFHLLNPDTRIRPGAVLELVAFLEKNSSVGIAGGVIERPDGSLFQCANRFPSILVELETNSRLRIVSNLLSKWTVVPTKNNEPCEADWVPGVSLMIRREVLETIGFMDEEYFLYYEETDFCLQAKRAGWPCWYVPRSQVLHFSGSSTGVTGAKRGINRRPSYWFRSRQRYFVKNHGWLYAALADAVWIISFSVLKVRHFFQRKKSNDPPFLLWDFLKHSVFVSGLCRLWADNAQTTNRSN